MAVSPLPTPNITEQYGEQLNNAIDSRYNENKSAIETLAEGVDNQIEAEVVDATAGHVPGTEMAYAQSIIGATTTVVYPSLQIVSSLTKVVQGEGRPVEIEFWLPLLYHSVAGAKTWAAIVSQITGSGVNVYEQVVSFRSPVNTDSNPRSIRVRKVLAEDTEYTFAFYVAGGEAGTTSYGASGGLQKMYSSVVSR